MSSSMEGTSPNGSSPTTPSISSEFESPKDASQPPGIGSPSNLPLKKGGGGTKELTVDDARKALAILNQQKESSSGNNTGFSSNSNDIVFLNGDILSRQKESYSIIAKNPDEGKKKLKKKKQKRRESSKKHKPSVGQEVSDSTQRIQNATLVVQSQPFQTSAAEGHQQQQNASLLNAADPVENTGPKTEETVPKSPKRKKKKKAKALRQREGSKDVPTEKGQVMSKPKKRKKKPETAERVEGLPSSEQSDPCKVEEIADASKTQEIEDGATNQTSRETSENIQQHYAVPTGYMVTPPPTMEEIKALFGIDDQTPTSGQENSCNPLSPRNDNSYAPVATMENADTPSSSSYPVDMKYIPTPIPPKPCLETERDYQNVALLSNYSDNDGTQTTTFEQAKKRATTRNTHPSPSNFSGGAPDLLCDPVNVISPEQHPLNAPNGGFEDDDDPIQDPIVLMEQRREAELRKRKFRQKKCCVLGLGFLLAVGVLSVVYTFVFGWGDFGEWNDEDESSPVVQQQYSGPPTMAPTLRPFSMNGLPEYTIQALRDPDTPQSKAHEWLSQDPNRDSYPDWRLKQRFAVATLVYAFHEEIGESLADDDWLVYDESECDWGFVTDILGNVQGELNYVFPPTCSVQGHIENLELSAISGADQDVLMASIPPEISLLPYLQRLGLSENSIFVPWDDLIPRQMTSLAPTLRILDLSNNEITRNITATSHLFQMKNLETLDASSNYLSGTLPAAELASLEWLSQLDLSNNLFSGSVSTDIAGLRNLEYLDLASTSLTGKIPSEMGLMALTSLDLSMTLLSGPIPSEIGSLRHTLAWLDLSSNALTGPLPTEIASLSKLEWLSLSLSSISGTLPSEIGGMKALKELNISNMLLDGSLPTELGSANELQRLDMSGNSASGTIPIELSLLYKLTRLDLGSNSLTGVIPAELLLLTNLKHLDLSNNFLTGSLPIEVLTGLTSLRVLRLGGNYLAGPLPSEIGLLTELVELDLSRTAINGTLPEELANLIHLETLSLSSNLISGTIPTGMSSMTALKVVNLRETDIFGEVPAGLCWLPNMESFVVNCTSVDCKDCDCDCR